MSTAVKTRSAAVRERLGHPVVDGDGHFVEILPVYNDYLREAGGSKFLDRYLASLPAARWPFDGSVTRVGGPKGWYGLTRAERREKRVSRASFWAYYTNNALDRATVMLPNLFRARLDDLGIDFAVVYGTAALGFLRSPDDEMRRFGCRAFNMMASDLYGPHADRLTVAAAIPMDTPEEALAELEFAVNKLGMKAVVLGTNVRRPIPEVLKKAPELAEFATWMDVIGISSDYDYDPVWKRCVELGVAAASHTNLMGWGARTLPDNFVYNHIGHFAASGEAFCKAVVIGGVVERFPTLKFAFLEGGVGWACSLFNDLIEHWEKRNVKALYERSDPAKLDQNAMRELFRQYGGKIADRGLDALFNNPAIEDPADLDDWSALKIEDPRRFAEIFENFFFGCESDDRLSAFAFHPSINHYGTKLNAFFSSDVGHFDVPDITTVVAEAYELVEDGLMSPEDFRDFSLTNVVRLHGGMNRDFFKGTIVEDAADKILTKERG
jgi:predicted TIM-barrel fold metal-dependent hydrolase